MRKNQVRKASIDELIMAFSEAARTQVDAIDEHADHKTANRASDLLFAIEVELRQRGRDAQCALLPLLKDDHPGVRLWAASLALEFSPSDGEPVLQALTQVTRSVGLNAEMTLKMWKRGELRFP